MSANAPSSHPGPGGMGPGGDMFGENFDESAFQQMAGQAANGGKPSGQAGSTLPGSAANPAQSKGTFQPTQPREVGSLTDELVTRPLKDIGKGLLSLFDFSAAMGIGPIEDKSPQDKARHQAQFQRYQKLTQEQKAYTDQRTQIKMKEDQQKKQEEAQKQQQEKQKQQQFVMPSSPKNGPIGPASGMSRKKMMTTQLEQDRQTLNAPAGAG